MKVPISDFSTKTKLQVRGIDYLAGATGNTDNFKIQVFELFQLPILLDPAASNIVKNSLNSNLNLQFKGLRSDDGTVLITEGVVSVDFSVDPTKINIGDLTGIVPLLKGGTETAMIRPLEDALFSWDTNSDKAVFLLLGGTLELINGRLEAKLYSPGIGLTATDPFVFDVTYGNNNISSVRGDTSLILQSTDGTVTISNGSVILGDGGTIDFSVDVTHPSYNIFKTIDTSSGIPFDASGPTDKILFESGPGITISSDAPNKKVIISSTGGATPGNIVVEDDGVVVQPITDTINFTGGGVTATDAGGGRVDVDVPLVIPGEINTASNLGSGEGIASTKTLTDLPFKSLSAGTNISLSSTVNEITITAALTGQASPWVIQYTTVPGETPDDGQVIVNQADKAIRIHAIDKEGKDHEVHFDTKLLTSRTFSLYWGQFISPFSNYNSQFFNQCRFVVDDVTCTPVAPGEGVNPDQGPVGDDGGTGTIMDVVWSDTLEGLKAGGDSAHRVNIYLDPTTGANTKNTYLRGSGFSSITLGASIQAVATGYNNPVGLNLDTNVSEPFAIYLNSQLTTPAGEGYFILFSDYTNTGILKNAVQYLGSGVWHKTQPGWNYTPASPSGDPANICVVNGHYLAVTKISEGGSFYYNIPWIEAEQLGTWKPTVFEDTYFTIDQAGIDICGTTIGGGGVGAGYETLTVFDYTPGSHMAVYIDENLAITVYSYSVGAIAYDGNTGDFTYTAANGSSETVNISATGTTQNLWETITANLGTDAVANSPTDTLNILGTGDISTSISGDTLTISYTGSGGSGEDNTASNKGVAGEGLFFQKTGVDLEFKSLFAGSNITFDTTNEYIVINADVPGVMVDWKWGDQQGTPVYKTISNDIYTRLLDTSGYLSTTWSVVGDGSSGNPYILDLTHPSTGLSDAIPGGYYISGYSTDITGHISGITTAPLPSGGGEDNTASNVGIVDINLEYGIFKQKSIVDLEFYSLKQGSGISLTQSGDNIVIDYTGTPGSSDGYIGLATDPSSNAYHTAGAPLHMSDNILYVGASDELSIYSIANQTVLKNDVAGPWTFNQFQSDVVEFTSGSSNKMFTLNPNAGYRLFHNNITVSYSTNIGNTFMGTTKLVVNTFLSSFEPSLVFEYDTANDGSNTNRGSINFSTGTSNTYVTRAEIGLLSNTLDDLYVRSSAGSDLLLHATSGDIYLDPLDITKDLYLSSHGTTYRWPQTPGTPGDLLKMDASNYLYWDTPTANYTWSYKVNTNVEPVLDGTILTMNNTANIELAYSSLTTTWDLTDTGVVAGSYANANVTVDIKGRVVTISSGAGGGTFSDLKFAGDSGSTITRVDQETLAITGDGGSITTTGIAPDTLNIAHTPTNLSPTGNSGAIVLQDITVVNGHITGFLSKGLSIVGDFGGPYDEYLGWNLQINTDPVLNIPSQDTLSILDGTAIELTLVGKQLTISHADTSNVSDSVNTGTTVLQSITFDSMGHVATIGTASISASTSWESSVWNAMNGIADIAADANSFVQIRSQLVAPMWTGFDTPDTNISFGANGNETYIDFTIYNPTVATPTKVVRLSTSSSNIADFSPSTVGIGGVTIGTEINPWSEGHFSNFVNTSLIWNLQTDLITFATANTGNSILNLQHNPTPDTVDLYAPSGTITSSNLGLNSSPWTNAYIQKAVIERELIIFSGDSYANNTITIKPPAGLAASYSFILPPNTGSALQTLTTDGTGITSWTTVSSGGGNTYDFGLNDPLVANQAILRLRENLSVNTGTIILKVSGGLTLTEDGPSTSGNITIDGSSIGGADGYIGNNLNPSSDPWHISGAPLYMGAHNIGSSQPDGGGISLNFNTVNAFWFGDSSSPTWANYSNFHVDTSHSYSVFVWDRTVLGTDILNLDVSNISILKIIGGKVFLRAVEGGTIGQILYVITDTTVGSVQFRTNDSIGTGTQKFWTTQDPSGVEYTYLGWDGNSPTEGNGTSFIFDGTAWVQQEVALHTNATILGDNGVELNQVSKTIYNNDLGVPDSQKVKYTSTDSSLSITSQIFGTTSSGFNEIQFAINPGGGIMTSFNITDPISSNKPVVDGDTIEFLGGNDINAATPSLIVVAGGATPSVAIRHRAPLPTGDLSDSSTLLYNLDITQGHVVGVNGGIAPPTTNLPPSTSLDIKGNVIKDPTKGYIEFGDPINIKPTVAPLVTVEGTIWYKSPEDTIWYDDGIAPGPIRTNADRVFFDNTGSNLTSVTVQDAIIEVEAESIIINGFDNKTFDSQWTFVEATRVFTISPTATEYIIYADGTRYIKTSAEAITIPNVYGIYFIYFDGNGILQATTAYTDAIYTDFAWITVIVFDAAEVKAHLQLEERHGRNMSADTKLHFHRTIGARWESGLAIALLAPVGGNGNLDVHAQILIADGSFRDEDLEHFITNNLPQQLDPIARIPMLYLLGVEWTSVAATDFPLLNTGTGRMAWNEIIGGVGQLTESINNDFVLTHIAATSDPRHPIIGVVGQDNYPTRNSAEAGAEIEIYNLVTGPFADLVPDFQYIATIIFQTGNIKTNAVKSSIEATDLGADYIDWRRNISIKGIIGGSSPSSHANLIGLASDDHLQYLTELRGDARYYTQSQADANFAALIHTHTESDITDLDRIRWKNTWVQQQYVLNEMVIDGSWTMIANKTTTDRAAPEAIGSPIFTLPEAPAWNTLGYTGQVQQELHIRNLIDTYSISSFRVYISSLLTTITYRIVSRDNITQDIQALTSFTGDDVQELGWLKVNANPIFINPGDDKSIILLTQDIASSVTITQDYIYIDRDRDPEATDPGIGNFTYNRDNYITRFSRTDRNALDVTAELDTITIGSTIRITDDAIAARWLEFEITDLPNKYATYYTYQGVLIGEGIDGRPDIGQNSTVLWNVVTAANTPYVLETGSYTGNPYLSTTLITGSPTIGTDGLGIDIEYQRFEYSPDWDLVSTIGGASNSGGSEPTPVDLDPVSGNTGIAISSDWAFRYSDTPGHVHDTSDITSGVFDNARISVGNVTQHTSSIDHNGLLNFVADRHIAHSSININAGLGLNGGGNISSSRTINLAINSLSGGASSSTDLIAVFNGATHIQYAISNITDGIGGTLDGQGLVYNGISEKLDFAFPSLTTTTVFTNTDTFAVYDASATEHKQITGLDLRVGVVSPTAGTGINWNGATNKLDIDTVYLDTLYGTMSSFVLNASSGSPGLITDGTFLNILQGTGILTSVANNSVTVSFDTSWGDGRYLQSIPATYMQQGDNNSLLTNDSGYITSFTEIDPVFTAHVSSGITGTQISNWDVSYGWGDHSTQGYITDAPSNGSTYGRRNGLWDVITANLTGTGNASKLAYWTGTNNLTNSSNWNISSTTISAQSGGILDLSLRTDALLSGGDPILKLSSRATASGIPSGFMWAPSGEYLNVVASDPYIHYALRLYVDTESTSRFNIRQDGKLSWGIGGSTTEDTFLYRAQATHLKTDGVFEAVGGITTGGNITATGQISAGTKFIVNGIDITATDVSNWDIAFNNYISDAPANGSEYVRKDNAWIVLPPGGGIGGGGVTNELTYWNSATDVTSSGGWQVNATNLIAQSTGVLDLTLRTKSITITGQPIIKFDSTSVAGIEAGLVGQIGSSPILNLVGANSSSAVLTTGTDGDPIFRFITQASGYLEWGNGTNNPDVNLSRTAAGILGISGTLEVGISSGDLNILNGSGYASGDFIGGHTFSDRNLKEDIYDSSYGLKDIMQMRPVTFSFKGEPRKMVGFIAQEMEQIVPVVVTTHKRLSDSIASEGYFKRIDYANITAVLVKAMQQQQDTIEDLTDKIKNLEDKVYLLIKGTNNGITD